MMFFGRLATGMVQPLVMDARVTPKHTFVRDLAQEIACTRRTLVRTKISAKDCLRLMNSLRGIGPQQVSLGVALLVTIGP